MLISVIVPVYNVEKYLRQCLDSLLQQSYRDLEIIMVDDGSQDSSGEICEEYAGKYPHFKVVHKQNAGLGMARNTGLEHITGQYVVFVDSDDYLDKDAIETLYKGLTENQVDMCKAGFRRVQDDGTILLNRSYQNEIYKGAEAKTELLPRMIGSSPSQHDSVEMCVCGAIYNVAPIKAHNLRFPSERELISEDLVFNIDYMQYANGACLIEKMGYNYRVNLRSLSTSYRADRFEASRHFYVEMKKKLISLGYDKNTMLRLDRMFFVYLRMCISQEDGKKGNRTKRDNLKKIYEICSDSVVRNTIANYPKTQLGLKQSLFLKLLYGKFIYVLYCLTRIKLI